MPTTVSSKPSSPATGNGSGPTAPVTPPGVVPNPPAVSTRPRSLDITAADSGGTAPVRLENIQGNIFGGFNKDFQTMLFLQFTNPVQGRAWLAHMARNIASSDDVVQFNNLFKLMRARHGQEGMVRATWTNIAFTFSGLQALEASDLDSFPQAYKDGMAARAALLHDVGDSAPANWVGGDAALGSTDIHAVLIVGSDIEDDVDPDRDPLLPNATVAGYIQNFGFNGTVNLLYVQKGRTRLDIRDAQGHTVQAGHEHFGFKDGVSQPGIRGVDTSVAVNCDGTRNPDQGNTGQDLLWPGEFVLGYPAQNPAPAPPPGVDGPNPNAGAVSQSGPAWTTDGSYLVFRRLRQDVQGFKDEVALRAPALALALGLPTGTDATDLMGAKIVGRYASGCPLEKMKCDPGPFTPSPVDPGIADPSLGSDDQKNNAFEYGYDTLGKNVPRGAHIRKAYPRDEPLIPGLGASESFVQTRRLLRRGIPFGSSLGADENGGADVQFPDDRGLLFLCYQSDLERQFEFVQTAWINNANFPCTQFAALKDDAGNLVYPNGVAGPDGEDPLIAQTATGPFAIPTTSVVVERIPDLKHFVTMTGGDYFFAPSILALFGIAQVAPPV